VGKHYGHVKYKVVRLDCRQPIVHVDIVGRIMIVMCLRKFVRNKYMDTFFGLISS
jgi:hypothetical protein